MIKHIQDAISYGLFEDFRAEDSTLVAGFHECFGEQLDCEEFSSWPDENEAGVLHLALGEDKQFKISIEEEQTRQLDITPIESEIAKMSCISKAGKAKDYYNVHDTIVVDGITFEIVGMGHDIDVLTGRNNTITLRREPSHIGVIRQKRRILSRMRCCLSIMLEQIFPKMTSGVILKPSNQGRKT